MRAARLAEECGPAGLTIEEVAAPVPGPGQIRVQVKATALNRADLLQTMGLYPAPPGAPADIPGLEYAGLVESVGVGVSRWQVGERVMGLVSGGAWAELLITDQREALRIPGQLSYAQAAAIPEAFITAFDALTLQGGMRAGDVVLIHAVGSGVGTAGVQWAKRVGAQTIGTSRTAAKLERAKGLGLDIGVLVDGQSPSWADLPKAKIALDLVGGTYLSATLEAMAPGGTVMLVGLTAGVTADLPLRVILSRRLRIQGTTLRSRTLEEKIAVAEAFATQVLPFFVEGKLFPVVGATVTLTDIKRALASLAANETFGKTVVTL